MSAARQLIACSAIRFAAAMSAIRRALVAKRDVLDRIEFASGDALSREAAFTSFGLRQRSALPGRLGCQRFAGAAIDQDLLTADLET